MNAFAFEETTDRRFNGAGQGIGLGRHCAIRGGATSTKTKSNKNDDTQAWPADAGRATGTWHGTGVWNDEPMRRPDHKAKKHSRPVRAKHGRRRRIREALEMLGAGSASMAVTLALVWPLRFEGEMLWVAVGAAV